MPEPVFQMMQGTSMLIQVCKGCEDQNYVSQGDYHCSKNAKEGIDENGLCIKSEKGADITPIN
jgi:hypothetical protein